MSIVRRSYIIGLLAGACVTEQVAQVEEAVKVCAAGPTLRGIDVSSYQGTIDWQKVKDSGVVFAYIRVSDGLQHPDSKFAANWAGARAVGVVRGAYQFFRENQDPIAQADLMLQTMGPLEADDLPPTIDVESTDSQTPAVIVDHVGMWMEQVRAGTGRAAVIYTGKYFWNGSAGGSGAVVDHPLWVPQWGPVCPDLPTPWANWAFFQYSASTTVPGISGNVDGDYFNGDMGAMTAFIGSPAPPDAGLPEPGPPDAAAVVARADARGSPAPGRLTGEVTGGCSLGLGGLGGAGRSGACWILLGLLGLTRIRRESSR